MNRSTFLQSLSAIGIGLFLPVYGCNDPVVKNNPVVSSDYQKLVEKLLKDWCDGMLKVQINKPEDSTIHGALDCPACNKIHGRCMDAVYPFMYMAQKTGEQKYMDAAIQVMDWSENVTMPDGSWTVIPDPKSWRGITVFGAIALAEALHYHGSILPDNIREQWMERLGRASDYIYKNFDLTFTNINYGFTAIHALHLIGHVLDRPHYVSRSRELSQSIKDWLTEPNYLIFGEGKPGTQKSDKGLHGVDLGYNVEETLNGLVQYALAENDEELLQLLTKSLEGHLQFMLPDGAWDNSWGSRQYKWSYWGSRTTDGCQPAFGLMAHRNPAFGTAAYLNTELLERCTADGLLHGGPHYTSHGVKPCVHHTFAHAKVLATLLDEGKAITRITKEAKLPVTAINGLKYFPELSVWLSRIGSWRATISSYDFIYKEKSQQASGGSLALLYHDHIGLIFAASMAKYMLVEKNNQQPQPQEDFALTPRLEVMHDGKWYTNLYDLKAQVEATEKEDTVQFDVLANLVDEDWNSPDGKDLTVQLTYLIEKYKVTIKAKASSPINKNLEVFLVLPLISPTGELVDHTNPNTVKVTKPKGKLILASNQDLVIRETGRERIFNMVPGVEAIPVSVNLGDGIDGVECVIQVK